MTSAGLQVVLQFNCYNKGDNMSGFTFPCVCNFLILASILMLEYQCFRSDAAVLAFICHYGAFKQ